MSESKTRVSRSESPSNARPSAIWGGRFTIGPDDLMQKINASIDFDQALASQDIAASKSHARMLAACGIISHEESRDIEKGLTEIAHQIAQGEFTYRHDLEDIHMNIEAALAERIGETAGKLHTARSRNDQVATDLRLWVRDALDDMDAALAGLQAALIDRAEENIGTIMPGFTHLQTAQPMTLGHHLMAYVEMFGRDRSRLSDARRRLNECPLGAAALAGTAFPIDPILTARDLGFDRPMANSVDAVSDRDFALDFLTAAAVSSMHISRLAEEIVLWSSDAFNFMTLSDSFSTGSSIMPQKRNPDAAELARAKTGRIFGGMMSLLVTLKGLPLAYSKDMQEDKEPVFDTAQSWSLCLAAMTAMIRDAVFNKESMAIAADRGYSTATDMADWLVRVLGLPFRRAHGVAGKIVALAARKKCPLANVPLTDLQAIEPDIDQRIYDVLTVEKSVASRESFGGTAPIGYVKPLPRPVDAF